MYNLTEYSDGLANGGTIADSTPDNATNLCKIKEIIAGKKGNDGKKLLK